jgi:hypothetical protein
MTSSAAVSSLWRPMSARKSCRLSAACQELDLVVGEIVLEREGLELGGLDVAALLRSLQEGAGRLGLEQLVKLVLGQFLLFCLRRRLCLDLSHCTAILLA